jgi:hypothetical protein
MTDRGDSRKPRSRAVLGALWGTVAVFLAVLAVLALRVGSGEDPALRARASATPLPPRKVLVRRIYERRVIVHLPASSPPQPTQASQQVSGAGGYASSLPVTRTS